MSSITKDDLNMLRRATQRVQEANAIYQFVNEHLYSVYQLGESRVKIDLHSGEITTLTESSNASSSGSPS